MSSVPSLTLALALLAAATPAKAQPPLEQTPEPRPESRSERVIVASGGWELIGDLVLPAADAPAPAVLMLNRADGDRQVYAEHAAQLARRGVASLRLDLRGHGESINRGRFVPGEVRRDPLIWDAEADVAAALAYLGARPEIDGERLGAVGASYSGEEMAEAARLHGHANLYVALSPGSFSDESIDDIDASGVPWLLVVSREERFVQEITAAVRERSAAEVVIVPGNAHATRLLEEQRDLAERLAVWIAHRI